MEYVSDEPGRFLPSSEPLRRISTHNVRKSIKISTEPIPIKKPQPFTQTIERNQRVENDPEGSHNMSYHRINTLHHTTTSKNKYTRPTSRMPKTFELSTFLSIR